MNIKPCQVLIDLGKLKTPHSGLGQFSRFFGKHISTVDDELFAWTFLTPRSHVTQLGSERSYEVLSLRRRYFPGTCRKYDLWHAIHQDSAYMPGDDTTAYVLTIHDLNFLEEKNDAKAKRRLRRLQRKVDRASAVTFVSDYTASVARRHLTIGGVPQRVVLNGVDIDTEKAETRPSFLPEGKFVFAIGLVLEKKNFHVLVDFVDQLPGYSLIIAGDKSDAYAHRIERMADEKDLSQRVILPGVITDDDKAYLYRNCEAFLMPSLMEGFGLPVVEAMRFGKPVFASRLSSLPEIGGEYAYYWESFDPVYMRDFYTDKIAHYKSNQPVLSEQIKRHSLKYSWEKSIGSYLGLYRELIGVHRCDD